MTPFQSQGVAEKFASYPIEVKNALLALREIAWETARSLPEVGEIEETLKWGEPAYGTKSKAGSTFRMDWKTKAPGSYALYFNCQTDLVDTFKTLFPNDFVFEGNRALVFRLGEAIPADSVAFCMAAAFSYHLNKKKQQRNSMPLR
ncbi:hypothetical protein LPB72_14320 [Hydrogenophaga crassostreae]|uniref:YdhG-like domain-containing protein n=1 Tax=Hydrogenophaga crassostreae TaxID=1763535 RepID=A0A167HEY1_9BURK|nr:DUF1801 domain-containing protein [Hydrogenophaga crassostreae]AOW12145.1 hypothetical protein LPB072_04070 [Hydrogenophaga crassostreae]OAD41090.1 hypothetical protein LPB72_14320 [Hydrogenophaga crassostreae]